MKYPEKYHPGLNINGNTGQSHSSGGKKGTNLFEVEVENLEHLNRVIREIKKVKGVIRVDRVRN